MTVKWLSPHQGCVSILHLSLNRSLLSLSIPPEMLFYCSRIRVKREVSTHNDLLFLSDLSYFPLRRKFVETECPFRSLPLFAGKSRTARIRRLPSAMWLLRSPPPPIRREYSP